MMLSELLTGSLEHQWMCLTQNTVYAIFSCTLWLRMSSTIPKILSPQGMHSQTL